MNDDNGFGTLLRGLRLSAGLSQESLAERARLSAESISALERGTRRAPYRETVRLLADALELTGARRAGLEAAAARPSRPRAGAAKEPSHNLPLALTSFHGRERERAELIALLDGRRLITLVGPGGVGKTRLVLETVAPHVRRFPGGVWFMDLAPLRSASPVAATIATVLGVREHPGAQPEQALVAKLQAGDDAILLVLDNCEHVLESVTRVVELLLSSCARVRFFATSREPLRIGAEWLYAVGPLPAASAERMFLDRAAAVCGDVDPARDGASIASIVRRLDGLPLALELAAARLRSLSPQQIAAALDARFAVLTAGSRTALRRHQTLRATLEWSHELLSQPERQVFRRCAVFAGSWTLAAAEAVGAGGHVDAEDVARCVMSLVDKSLIVATRDEVTGASRFTMLETTHQYALERLEECGERQRVAERHFEHVTAVLQSANEAYERTGSDEQLASLWPDLDNVRLALHWSRTGGHTVAGGALAAASGRLWHRVGLSTEGIRRLHELATASGIEGTVLAARIWTALSCLHFSSGRIAPSLEAAERAVAIARAHDDPPTLILALLEFGHAAARVQRLDEAGAAVDEAERLAGALPPGLQRLRLLNVRAVVSAGRGDFARAAVAFRTAFETYRRLGDEYGMTTVIMNLAEAQHAAGETASAIGSVRGRLPFSIRELDRERHVTLLTNLTGYLAAAGDCAGARAVASEALELCAAADPASAWVTVVLEHLALALALDDEPARAALLAGYCNPALAACGYVREFTEQTTHDRLTVILGERFSAAELQTLLDEGAAFTPQRAIDAGLRASR